MLTPSEREISLVLSGIVNHKNRQAPDPPFLKIIREFVTNFRTCEGFGSEKHFPISCSQTARWEKQIPLTHTQNSQSPQLQAFLG